MRSSCITIYSPAPAPQRYLNTSRIQCVAHLESGCNIELFPHLSTFKIKPQIGFLRRRKLFLSSSVGVGKGFDST